MIHWDMIIMPDCELGNQFPIIALYSTRSFFSIETFTIACLSFYVCTFSIKHFYVMFRLLSLRIAILYEYSTT